MANGRILTTAAGLSDDQLHAAATLDHGSAFQTIRHLMDFDWSWRHSPGDLDLLDALVLRWPADRDEEAGR